MKRKLFNSLAVMVLLLTLGVPVLAAPEAPATPGTFQTTNDNDDNAHSNSPDNDMDTYLCSGDGLLPIEFDIQGVTGLPHTTSAHLVIKAYDVDEESGEIDDVWLNDPAMTQPSDGTMAGTNGTWSMSIIDVSSVVQAGTNQVDITVATGWCIEVDWGQIVIDGGQQVDAKITDLSASGSDWNNIQIDVTNHATTTAVYGQDFNLLDSSGNNLNIVQDEFSLNAGDDINRNHSMSTGYQPADGEVFTIQSILYDNSTGFIHHIRETTWTYAADDDGDGIPNDLECWQPSLDTCDTDNDGVDDDEDLDADGDGIHDILECPDPLAGCTDSDGDGIPDFQESNKSDSDGDGTPDQYDGDNDNDDEDDEDEWGFDTDDDGIMDCFENDDYDSDGDGLNDENDKDADADGIRDGCCIASGCSPYVFNCEQFDDTDHDNIPDRLESNYFDTDGGTLADYADMDSDGDGEFDFEEKAFADGDTDGVPDRLESDEHDSDGDGRPDEADSNSDDDNAGNDGNEHTTAPNDGPGFYNDKDADGIPDRYESNNHYSDTDCTPDDEDTDSDDDNISDHDEWYRDTDGDHVPDRYESNILDTDADGDVDYLDTDSDDDGILDGDDDGSTGGYDEGEGLYDADGDHVPDRVEPLWHYSDGADVINDGTTSGVGFGLIADGTYTGTFDGTYPVHTTLAYTGTDQYDWDSDDDNISDGACNGGEGLADKDGDGILDRFESNTRDSDGDDIFDWEDTDSDDDGTPDGGPGERLDDEDDDLIPNRIESSSARSKGLLSGNTDQYNGNSDDDVAGDDDAAGERLDDDVDNDGIPDRLEADNHYSDAIGKDAFVGSYPDGYDENDNDADNDCRLDGDIDGGDDHEQEGLDDKDGDGVPDRLEHNTRDTDGGDGKPDYDDTDSDNDGSDDGSSEEWLQDSDGDLIPNRLESNTTDTDGDGTFDYMDTDADGDGITDTVEILDAPDACDSGFKGDRDGDEWWNYVDYNPTGYFYNKATGEIIASSEVAIDVEGPPGAVITITHSGDEGFYQFSTDRTAGIYTLTLKSGPPTGYALACEPETDPYNPAAPIDPPYDPADVSEIFNGEYQDTGFLREDGCTPYHWTFSLGDNDRVIINNNIGLVPTVGGHTEILYETSSLVEWGLWLLAMAVTGLVAVLSFRRRAV